jgi:predicted ATPase
MLKDRPYLQEVSLKRDEVASYDPYPYCIPAVRELYGLEFHRDVTFIVGENGCGKSTLLEAIAVAWGFNAEGGSKNFRFSTRNLIRTAQNLRLVKSINVRDGYFRAESFFNLATDIEAMDAEPAPSPPVIDSYGGRSLHEQSTANRFLPCC